jgi:hypothetical protein
VIESDGWFYLEPVTTLQGEGKTEFHIRLSGDDRISVGIVELTAEEFDILDKQLDYGLRYMDMMNS